MSTETSPVAPDVEPRPQTAEPDRSSPARRRPGRLADPGLVAVAVWVVLIVPAVAVPRLIPFQGFGVKGWAAPLAGGLVGGAVILGLAFLRRGAAWVAGAGAGFLAAWVSLVLGTILRGTPFPFYGLLGDAGQLTAMATRYSVTAASADPWVPGLPAEYPPLFPWTVGRISTIIDVPAWQLVGTAEVICTGLALLVGFLLWQRLVPVWIALATSALGFMTLAYPPKAYELLTLLLFVPWVLGTLGRPSRGRLHWVTSGVVAGIIVLTYYGWVVFGGLGLIAIAVITYRSEPSRRAYLLYLVKVAGVAAAVSSWFVLPFLYARIRGGGEAVSDMYADASMLHDLLPFIGFTPLALLQLVGVFGLFWLRGSAWWATPMLALVLGAYAYRAVTALLFVLTRHTYMGHYTPRLYSAVLVMAGVLTLVRAVPRLLDRLLLVPPKGGAAVALSITMAWCGLTFTLDWMPGLGGRYAGIAETAYLEPLPDGRYVADLPRLTKTRWFPVVPIRRVVESVYGPNPRRVTLTADERLFSYLPWPGYAGNTPLGSLAHTSARVAELRRLAGTHDPTAFARASATTAFGPIDIFVLRETDDGWRWSSYVGFEQAETVVLFDPNQFSAAEWVVFDTLPEDVVVAVRRL
jgi:Arabinofuranosyltransferase N terminal